MFISEHTLDLIMVVVDDRSHLGTGLSVNSQKSLESLLEWSHIEMGRHGSCKSLLLLLGLGLLQFASCSLLWSLLVLLATSVSSLLLLLVPVQVMALSVEVPFWKTENLQSVEQELLWLLDVVVDVVIIDFVLNEVLIWVSDLEVDQPLCEEVLKSFLFGKCLQVFFIAEKLLDVRVDLLFFFNKVLLKLHSL